MPQPYDWAVQFETESKQMMLAGTYEPLVEYEKLGKQALFPFRLPNTTCRYSTFLRQDSLAN